MAQAVTASHCVFILAILNWILQRLKAVDKHSWWNVWLWPSELLNLSHAREPVTSGAFEIAPLGLARELLQLAALWGS